MPIDTDLSGISYARLGHDLPSVACQAALELDNLLRGRGLNLAGVRELSLRLDEEAPEVADLNSPLSLVDPSTVVALHGTLRESGITTASDEIAELTRHAREVINRLKAASDDPQGARSNLEEVRKLKDFCLILSRRSAATTREPDDVRQSHPSRRWG